MISNTLKTDIGFCGPTLGFEVKDVSDRYLCSAGAMDLLCTGVDSNIIKLIDRWQSDNILSYLHVQAEPLMRNFSLLILTRGNYIFLPHQDQLPCF